MIIPIELRFKADKDSKSAFRTDKTIKSHDVNSVEFHISIDGLELTDDYTAKILSVFHSSKTQVNVDCEISEGKIIYKPDATLISIYEHVTNYVYVYNDNQSLDVCEFIYAVNLSKIDETSLKVKEVYDQSYADLLADFEQALEDYKLTLPQADSVRADIDEILNQFSEDSQAKLNQYDDDAQQVITDNQTAFDLAETGRQDSYVQAESERNQLSSQAVVDWEQDADALLETVEGNESARVDAETTRKTAETDRVSSESTRKTNETTRVSNEDVRKSNEQGRVSAESVRVANEAERISKDSERDSKIEAVEGLQADLISGAVDSAAVQQHVEERYGQLEEEYAPKLTNLEQNKADKDELSELQSYVGYTEHDIVGIEADLQNRRVTRIAGAVNRSAGAMFDDIFAFGGRARVNLTNDGVEVATFGDGAYTETGKLTQAVTIDGTTYSIGTNVQTMVRQPKFYYKLVPLSLRPIEDGDGFHMDKFRLYISDEAKAGFKLHRAFKSGEKTNNKIYLSAFEASAYDVTTGTYNMIDSQDVAFAEDLLSSIANAKPISGATQQLTLAGARQLAQNRGAGWNQSNLLTASVTQMLFMVEYATLNSQTALGQGIYIADGDPDPAVPVALPTGATTALGNGSGNVESGHVTYRGEENLWANIYAWVDGFMVGISGEHKARVAGMNANYVESNPDASPDYDKINFTMSKTNGWISAFGYDEEHDYVFIPTETTGNSAVPVGDNFYQNHTSSAWLAPIWGGDWASGSRAGLFVWHANSSPASRHRNRGARLVYASDN